MRSCFIVLLAVGATLTLVEFSTQVPAPAHPTDLEMRRDPVSRVTPPMTIPCEPPRVEPEVESLSSTEPEMAPENVPPTSIDDLLAELRDAWNIKDRIRGEALIDRIRIRLETPDRDVELAVAREVHRKGLAATKLLVMLLDYHDTRRRRILRSLITEAAPPAPAALPSLLDPLAVADLLGGPRPAREKLWVLKRLDAEVLVEEEVRTVLLSIVVRSVDGGKLATTALRHLGLGTRREVESIAIRTIDSGAHVKLRRASVRLLGKAADAEGVRRLILLVRDDPDVATRRLAASALYGHPLDAEGIATLRGVAADVGEDPMVRMNALRTLQGIARRAGPSSMIASEAVLSVASDLTPGPEAGVGHGGSPAGGAR